MTGRWGVATWLMVMLLVSAEHKAYGQFSEPCRAPHPQDFRAAVPSQTGRLVEFVPSLCVSERYDSNVYFRPATAGLTREDYVTSVNPSLRVNHNGDYVTGFLDAGGVSETHINNSGLNFLGSNGTLSLNLDNTVKRILPNASLSVSDAVSYAPSPPGFVNPVAGTSPGAPTNIQDVFAQGILFFRTNRLSNSGTVTASYVTSPRTTVTASYSHGIMRFLSDAANLFDTTTQTGTVGGTAQLSRDDQLNVRYSFAHTEFGNSAGSSFLFNTHTATAGWSRTLTQYLTVEVGGGGIVIDSGRTTYAANAAVITKFANTRATIGYARSAFPSYVGVATQIVGDVVSVSAVHQIGPQWQLTGGANYSRSSGTGGNNAIKFDSYGGSVNLAYLISRIWTIGLGYTYHRFDQEFGTTQNQFDRHVAMFSVRATWE